MNLQDFGSGSSMWGVLEQLMEWLKGNPWLVSAAVTLALKVIPLLVTACKRLYGRVHELGLRFAAVAEADFQLGLII